MNDGEMSSRIGDIEHNPQHIRTSKTLKDRNLVVMKVNTLSISMFVPEIVDSNLRSQTSKIELLIRIISITHSNSSETIQ
jgi:predicted RNA methylase